MSVVLSFKRRLLVSLLATAAAATPAAAQVATGSGQTTGAETPSTTGGDDIIVTAQKRDENIQNVPLSIQAIGTRKLDQLNISNFNQYTQLLPSVAFQTSQPGVTTVYMRGVASGGDGNHSGSLPSVGVYLDEQPVTTIGGTLDVHVYDIARIESLAGPQGTLYGASSEAGTIRIITNKPDLSGFYGRVDGEVNTVAHGGVGYVTEGMLNIPLASMMALRVVGFYQKDAGFIDNVAGTRSFIGGITVNNNAFVKNNYNDTETYGGRAALKIDLDDNWTVTPTVLYQEQRNHGSYAYDPKVGDLKVQRFFPEYRRDRFVQAALTIEGKLGNWDVTYAGSYLDRKALQSSDYTDYAEAYDSLYSSVGGLAGYFYYQDNAGNTIDPRQRIIGTDHFKKTSQELRVASPADAPFRLVAGAFYQRQSNLIFQDYQIANLGSALSVNGYPGTLWLTRQHRVDKDYAVFGEASYDLTPKLSITAGARGYIYDNSLVGFFGFGRNPGVDPADGRAFSATPFNAAGSSRTGVAGCYLSGGGTLRDRYLSGGAITPFLNTPDVGAIPCTNLGVPDNAGGISPKQADGQGVTYRFTANWKPVQDVLIYGTWSRGFRPGGINRRGDVADYAADFLTNYELGWKTTLLGGAVRFNGAIYQQNWDAFQFAFLGANSFTVIQNGPNARIRGIESDINVNTGPLSLSVAGSYTDAQTRQNLCLEARANFVCDGLTAGGQQNLISAPAGTRLPITPRFKISGSARYTVPIGTVKGYVQALVAHQSSASSDIRTAVYETGTGNVVNPAALLGRLEAYTTGNLAVGAELQRFTLEVFARNIWDERGQIARYQQCGSCYQRPYIVPVTPRTIGVRLGAKF
ncbi:TonB-dependent receptor [Sphingomonas sp.]|jgi:outer membrane receptor protein involved in Fe transport|uniref:TonB-dependent receptor n=1 Tax=Sphingomonas sp. TaxID=28214 RepID=UPI0035C84185